MADLLIVKVAITPHSQPFDSARSKAQEIAQTLLGDGEALG